MARRCAGSTWGVFADATASFEVLATGAPEQYAWTTDGQTTTLADTIAVTVNRTAGGSTAQAVVHLAAVGRRYGWLTDCTRG